MKSPKAFLPFGTKTFIEYLVETCLPFVSELRIVMQEELIRNYGSQVSDLARQTTMVSNPFPERGRYYSLLTGLRGLRAYPYYLILNVDNPLNSSTLEKLFEHRFEEAYAVPVYRSQRGHPILVTFPVISAILQETRLDANLRQVLANFPVKEVAVDDPDILLNLNTPELYQDYLVNTLINA